ncbi:CsbD family protein [Actinacidiphila rubida]|uniref:CsbD-like n=1 Tax=Actinacidiphila rubida TaxID=310780 RepID=A0A1H8EK05_9ACTN|nr:CsbD family protein [Actinacidiphila rubida]SEN19197.1 CsbD-like [Actinacidiphila rubida]
MSASDKAHAKTDQVKGKAKETAGHAVGNERLEAEGRADQAKGDAREAGEKIKDAAKDVLGD